MLYGEFPVRVLLTRVRLAFGYVGDLRNVLFSSYLWPKFNVASVKIFCNNPDL